MYVERSLLSLALGVALAITLALLSACGGGGDDGTEDQARILRDWGCHEGQGFLYSPAIPADQLLTWSTRRA